MHDNGFLDAGGDGFGILKSLFLVVCFFYCFFSVCLSGEMDKNINVNVHCVF